MALKRKTLSVAKHTSMGWSRFCALLCASFSFFLLACNRSATESISEAQSWEQNLDKMAQLIDSIKCIVPSPAWYKSLWIDLNSKENLLGRNLMSHYMSCSGKNYLLSEAEFRTLPIQLVKQDFGPIFLRRDYINEVIRNRIGMDGDKIADINESVIAATHYGNTLGNFQLELKGVLVWRKNDFEKIVPHFRGQAKIRDRYDFNPSETSAKDSWRGRDTELRVRIAHVGLPGRAFNIESDWMNFSFDYPKYEDDLIQETENNERSGYSEYGERVQAILMTELRSSRWEKASNIDRVRILLQTMRRIHESLPGRAG